MNKFAKMVLCGGVALSLSGCQSFLGDLGLAKNRSADGSMASAADGSRLDLGRQALKAGSPGNAIHHFERAIFDPKHAVDAYNGMGVSYAMLGREDLAERFFNAALMLRPTDKRIARNLERLYNSNLGQSRRARARKASDANDILAQAEADAYANGLLNGRSTQTETTATVTVDRRRGNMDRKSGKEVIIGKAAPKPVKKDTVAAAGSMADSLMDLALIGCPLDAKKGRTAAATVPARVQLGS